MNEPKINAMSNQKNAESTEIFGAQNDKITNLTIAGGLQETHYFITSTEHCFITSTVQVEMPRYNQSTTTILKTYFFSVLFL